MISIYYDIISPYSYIGLELFKRSRLYKDEEFELIPVLLINLLREYKNPGPNGIEGKRLSIIKDTCLQAKFFDIDFIGPPRHPFINLVPMRFLHCIDDMSLRFKIALILNRACWGLGKAVEAEEQVVKILQDKNILNEQWEDLDVFIKQNKGRQRLKEATALAISKKIFGVPTFYYDKNIFWGSDRLNLLEDYKARKDFYKNINYEKILSRSTKPKNI